MLVFETLCLHLEDIKANEISTDLTELGHVDPLMLVMNPGYC